MRGEELAIELNSVREKDTPLVMLETMRGLRGKTQSVKTYTKKMIQAQEWWMYLNEILLQK